MSLAAPDISEAEKARGEETGEGTEGMEVGEEFLRAARFASLQVVLRGRTNLRSIP